MLQQQLGQLARLQAVLLQEQAALQQRDGDALSAIDVEKQQLVSDLDGLSRNLTGELQAAGHGSDKGTLHTFITAEATLQPLWQQLEAALLACRKQNQVNGILLEKGRQQTQQLLSILLGGPSQKDGMLYDAKGSASSSLGNGRSVKV